MKVLLKFKCTELRKSAGSRKSGEKTAQGYDQYVPCEVGGVKLTPVSGGSPENESFYNATPGGQIDFSTINEEALKIFEIGAEYLISVERAP